MGYRVLWIDDNIDGITVVANIVIDVGRDGRVDYANPTAADMTGCRMAMATFM